MLGRELLDCLVLLLLNLFDFVLPLVFHLLSQIQHLVLEFEMDLVRDSFKVLSQLGLGLVLLLSQGIEILSMPHFLLFLADLERSQILLELSGVDAVLIFHVLESDLVLLFQFSELIQVLEDEMLAPLLVDLDLNLMLFLKILQLSLFISQLRLFIF